jgi:hypothetical protein
MTHRTFACRIFLPLTLALVLSGCLSNPFGEVPEKLMLQVRTFEDVVRWGALQKMYLFEKHDPDKPVQVPEGLENVRVTSYELANPLTKVNDTRWTQTAVIDYVLTDRQVVRQLIDQQVWVSDDEGKSWYRQTPVPQFR